MQASKRPRPGDVTDAPPSPMWRHPEYHLTKVFHFADSKWHWAEVVDAHEAVDVGAASFDGTGPETPPERQHGRRRTSASQGE